MSEEEKKEEQQATQPKKEKAPKRRVKVYSLYRVEGERIQRLRKDCPRCGKGYFMAEHADRSTCGNCGFTVYKNPKK